MHVMSVARFEHFFREVASLDVDKEDLRHFDEFINGKIYDLLLRAQANAHANIRDVIQPQDLPIGNGLQENIERFRRLDAELELTPILDYLTTRPKLDKALSDETEQLLPQLAGGVSVAVARTFKIIDPTLKNPHAEQWDRCARVFDELL
jgi:hypothetical protein